MIWFKTANSENLFINGSLNGSHNQSIDHWKFEKWQMEIKSSAKSFSPTKRVGLGFAAVLLKQMTQDQSQVAEIFPVICGSVFFMLSILNHLSVLQISRV
jgi:hypothetical protein